MTPRSKDADEVTKTRGGPPDFVKRYAEVRPLYEQLCGEIASALRERIGASAIECAAITSRAKSLESFAEKLSRKHYDDPLRDVTDLAGVRLVYLYKSDRPAIEGIIESEFEVAEKVDKIEEQEADRFGYGALHYLVRLSGKSPGVRYLKGMVCEIQVRTVLQDAWAVVDHHLSYKQEADVPKALQRKINSLSGLFETADDQLDRVRTEREAHKERHKVRSGDGFLDREISLETLAEFLRWRFPGRVPANDDRHLSQILAAANAYQYARLSDLDGLLKRTEGARAAINSKSASPYTVVEIARALALVHPAFRAKGWDEDQLALLSEYESLLPS